MITFVLVHGGGVTGRYWDRLVPHLRHPALAVDLPGRAGKDADPMTLTVDDCVASVVDDVRAAQLDDVVLVAHSSGGLFAPGIATALGDQVRAVVLDAANVTPEGGTGLDAMKASHRDRVIETMTAARRDGWVLRTPGPEPADKVRGAYGGDDLDDDQIEFVTDPARCVRDSMNFYFQPVSWATVPDIPVTYVRHSRDRPTPPALQDANIERLGRPVRIVELDCGHIPAVTNPVELAALLDEAADAVEPDPRA